MRPLPHEGIPEGGLCCSLLRLVQSDQQVKQLREELSSFSHRCRNLLNAMKMSLYFMRRGAEQPLPQWWEGLERNYRGIEQLLDQVQAIYRPISLTLINGTFRCLIKDRQQTWSEWFARGSGNLEIVPPEQESACEFDPMYLAMGFDALARWRASVLLPGQSARLSWRASGVDFEVAWHERGGTAPASTSPSPQTSPDSPSPCMAHLPLALPLLARIMTAHRGTLNWSRQPDFHAVLSWPLKPSSTITPAPDPPLTGKPESAYHAND
jgi:hypothetical protein